MKQIQMFFILEIDIESQILALFDRSALFDNSQKKNPYCTFFLSKNLLNFASLSWKLENPNCHSVN